MARNMPRALPGRCIAALFAFSLVLLMFGPAQAASRHLVIENESLGPVAIEAPLGEPTAFLIVIASAEGFSGNLGAEVAQLVEHGWAVATLEPDQIFKGLAAGDETSCHYLMGRFEDISRLGQQRLGTTMYHWPILLGAGKVGGTLAYLAAAQSPVNTTAGGIASGFDATLASRLPFCMGARWRAEKSGLFRYRPPKTMPCPFRFLAGVIANPDVARFVAHGHGTKGLMPGGTPESEFAVVIGAAMELARGGTGDLADLPLFELPARSKPRALALMFSGDGGWRDIDRLMSQDLARSGVAVIGIDSLRYFWLPRTPDGIAQDIGRITRNYEALWGTKRAMLLGYSFGAGVIPFAYAHLPVSDQNRIILMGLMAVDPMTSFQTKSTDSDDFRAPAETDMRPLLAAMPASKIICVYGSLEKSSEETICLSPALREATLIRRPGEHHFDGDTRAITRQILARLARLPAQ